MSDQGVALNTDREIWREREGDYYADSIHITEGGSIGINCGGMVVVRPVREWHRLASIPTISEAYWDGWNDACDAMIGLSWWKRAYAELKRGRPLSAGKRQDAAKTAGDNDG